jgi:hypothetical protein
MTYACLACEFVEGNQLLKLQLLRNKVLRATGKLLKRTTINNLRVQFKIPYLPDFVRKNYADNRHNKSQKCKCLQRWPRRGSA